MWQRKKSSSTRDYWVSFCNSEQHYWAVRSLFSNLCAAYMQPSLEWFLQRSYWHSANSGSYHIIDGVFLILHMCFWCVVASIYFDLASLLHLCYNTIQVLSRNIPSQTWHHAPDTLIVHLQYQGTFFSKKKIKYQGINIEGILLYHYHHTSWLLNFLNIR